MYETLGNLFSTLWEWLTEIVDSILSLPSLIIDGIKSIFIPDTDQLKADFNNMLDSISNSFGISFDSIGDLSDSWEETPATDIEKNYNIHGVGTLKLKFFDTKYLIQGIEYFRPLIRGFVVFLLLLYNYYQILTFIGQDPRIAHNAEQSYNKYVEKGAKK